MFTDYHLVISIICAVFAFNIKMERFSKTKIALFLCGLCFAATANGISIDEPCLIAYIEGGAPAIFQSPKCTGRNATKEAKVDVLAIFDGHGGAEASEMANQKLLDYFITHVYFYGIKKAVITVDQHYLNSACPPTPDLVLSVDDVEESPQDTLKKALMHAIHDIDMEFSLEAYEKHYYGGSTATVVLLLNDEEILVASLGDSPALLCTGWKKLRAEKLTRNHRPDEEDERARIEAAGGFVQVLGVPRVNGRLAVSRAIGDISLKRFGVIAEPEVKGWRSLTRKDAYLVIASDGIFKGLTPDNVCKAIELYGTSTSSLSEIIVGSVLKNGSMDNLSVAVFPLRQPPTPSPSQPSKDEEL